MLLLTFELRDVPQAIDELREQVDRGTQVGATEAMLLVAGEAQRNHRYENRTGELEGSTGPGNVEGTFSDGDLEFSVVAESDHASYVEASRCRGKDTEDVLSPGPWAFLQPAFDRSEERINRDLDRQLQAAVRRAGWSSR